MDCVPESPRGQAAVAGKPKVLSVIAENVPEDLRSINRWLGWRWEEIRPGKWTKPPYSIHTGQKCDKTDPSSWCSFDEAIAAHRSGRFDGVGFCFTEDDDLAGVDLDDCVDPVTGELNDQAKWIVAMLDSYSEISPSGEGVKIFLRAKFNSNKADHKKGIEVCQSGSYFCVTGRRLENVNHVVSHCSPCQTEILWEEAFGDGEKPRFNSLSDREVAVSALAALPASYADSYLDWIHVGMMLYTVDDGLFDEWDRWSQSSEKYVSGECRKKWDSFNGDGAKRLRLGTLVHLAMKNGWTPPTNSNGASPGNIKKETEKAAKRLARIEPFVPFPVDALPEPICGFVTAISTAIGCDPCFVALPCISAMAGCM
ncbi:MAG: PriCT-2 domain-containing protein [Planctomycetia bacterium]|nr:PriCT-2 domain-containing protein [Planctomycetia bacterium]